VDRIKLMASVVEGKVGEPPIQVAFPEVVSLFPLDEAVKFKSVPERVNILIRQLVEGMMLQQGWGQDNLLEMIGTFRVTLNKKGILSIRFENFSMLEMQAHPSTIVRGLTVDLKTGKAQQLSDFFKINSGYRLIISEEIKRQIKARGIELISDFNRINDDQEFYLTDKALVIFFQEGTLAPRVWGMLEFPIPYTLLANVINQEGLLARLQGGRSLRTY
jgi:hypothetical protein